MAFVISSLSYPGNQSLTKALFAVSIKIGGSSTSDINLHFEADHFPLLLQTRQNQMPIKEGNFLKLPDHTRVICDSLPHFLRQIHRCDIRDFRIGAYLGQQLRRLPEVFPNGTIRII
jgi:hypothetical protein